MKSVQIKLKLAENVKSFVQKVAVFPGELDLRSGRYVVDAKSILGIFSLDLSGPLQVQIEDWSKDYAPVIEKYLDWAISDGNISRIGT